MKANKQAMPGSENFDRLTILLVSIAVTCPDFVHVRRGQTPNTRRTKKSLPFRSDVSRWRRDLDRLLLYGRHVVAGLCERRAVRAVVCGHVNPQQVLASRL